MAQRRISPSGLGAFSILPNVVNTETMKYFDPKGVISLCITSGSWNQNCNNIQWATLLKQHFPHAGLIGNTNRELREHYARLALGVCTQYMVYHPYDFLPIVTGNLPSGIEILETRYIFMTTKEILDKNIETIRKYNSISSLNRSPTQYEDIEYRKALDFQNNYIEEVDAIYSTFNICGNPRSDVWLHIERSGGLRETLTPFASKEEAVENAVKVVERAITINLANYIEIGIIQVQFKADTETRLNDAIQRVIDWTRSKSHTLDIKRSESFTEELGKRIIQYVAIIEIKLNLNNHVDFEEITTLIEKTYSMFRLADGWGHVTLSSPMIRASLGYKSSGGPVLDYKSIEVQRWAAKNGWPSLGGIYNMPFSKQAIYKFIWENEYTYLVNNKSGNRSNIRYIKIKRFDLPPAE